MATPTTLAELAPFWRADDNEGVSLESVSKEIAAYKPGGTFAEDYAAFVQLLQVVAHPKVGAVAIAKPGDKAEGDEGEEKPRTRAPAPQPRRRRRHRQAAHEAALGRLADLNKAIASGKKPGQARRAAAAR
ncbi:hypothetical protein JL720_17101 [Aureococcus anophagefferens]|nr:hypothetical protein JL720_17101 [Aureococcus anophagefferens]